MKWNPITHPFCEECPFYEPEGRYIYELEQDKKERMCRHLRRCWRVAKMRQDKQLVFKMPEEN